MRRKISILLCACFFIFSFTNFGFCQQVVPEGKSEITQVNKSSEKIVSSPKDIKERTNIYVFVAWMWLAIFVLLYIFRQKIKEVDRLYHLEFFKSDRK